MQAVKAYYNEGAFVPFQPVFLPKGSHAIVTILDFEIGGDTGNPTSIDAGYMAWYEKLRKLIDDSMDEELPDSLFQRSTEMRPPVIF